METKFKAKELSGEQTKNATTIITSIQAMLANHSFNVLGLENGRSLSQNETLKTLADYRDSGNMTEEQNQQIAKLAVDTRVRTLQLHLSPSIISRV